VIRVLLDFWPGTAPDLDDVIRAACAGFTTKMSKTSEETVVAVLSFLSERLRHVLVARGQSADEVDAVLGARRGPLDDLRDTAARVEALRRVRAGSRDAFAALGEGFKRAKNIIGESPEGAPGVSVDLFQDDAERALFEGIAAASATDGSNAAARLLAVAGLRDRVDAFFRNVMVNADDPAVRANRHALLRGLLDLVYDIADLSRLN
jgi:glycyl-tRNA synthetase beta chain